MPWSRKGNDNTISSGISQAVIAGGGKNTVSANGGAILGGCSNTVSSGQGFIGGGCANTNNGCMSGIISGKNNNINSKTCSFIIGTDITALSNCTTFVNNFAFHAHNNQTPYLGTAATAGELIYIGSSSVTTGNLYYLLEPVSGTSSWTLADADAASSSTNMLAIAAGTGNSNAVGMMIRGFARFTSVFNLTGGTIGQPLYVHTTAGAITQTAPSGTGDVVRVVGHLIDDSTEVIYFNPDGAWVEIS